MPKIGTDKKMLGVFFFVKQYHCTAYDVYISSYPHEFWNPRSSVLSEINDGRVPPIKPTPFGIWTCPLRISFEYPPPSCMVALKGKSRAIDRREEKDKFS